MILGSADVSSYGIIDMGGGWYRVFAVVIAAQAGTATLTAFLMPPTGTSVTYTGDGVSGAYAWGMQIEQGVTLSSYIPTAGATATRAADSLVTPTAADWFNPAESTVFFEGLAPPVGDFSTAIQIDDGSSDNRFMLRLNQSNLAQAFFTAGGVTVAQSNLGTVAPGSPIRMAGSIYPGGMSTSLNGAAVVTEAFATAIPVMNRLRIGSGVGVTPWGAALTRASYHPRRLSSAERQRMAA